MQRVWNRGVIGSEIPIDTYTIHRFMSTKFAFFSPPLFGVTQGNVKSSTNCCYILVPSVGPEILCVKRGCTLAYSNLERIQTVRIQIPESCLESEYDVFTHTKFDSPEQNDCLEFAEYVLTGSHHPNECVLVPKALGGSSFQTVGAFPEEQFATEPDAPEYDPKFAGCVGNTDPHNVRLAMILKQKYPTHINASLLPETGEAIMIVFTRWVDKTYTDQAPYHVAPVIGRDGDWILTVEADAGDPNRERPVFDMYSVKQECGLTFWDRYSSAYGGDTAVAFVLTTLHTLRSGSLYSHSMTRHTSSSVSGASFPISS